MARLLYRAAFRETAGGASSAQYARRLLALFPAAVPERAAPGDDRSAERALIEPLSERELEVLGLFSEGLTNREIADRLILSLNTVKAHASNIYGKLGVHSRARAVVKARALGLLSGA
jgi:LuxR family maltose regulon positive regulatory protein